MAEDGHASSTDQPQHRGDGRGPDAERDGDDQKSGVELRRGGAGKTEVQVPPLQLADAEHAAHDQDDDEEEEEVGEEAVDAEHDEDDRVVAAEVGEVVVDAVLHIAEVPGFGQTLEVEKLADGLEVGETVGYGLRADGIEAAGEIESGSEGVERDVDARHGRGGWCVGVGVRVGV